MQSSNAYQRLQCGTEHITFCEILWITFWGHLDFKGTVDWHVRLALGFWCVCLSSDIHCNSLSILSISIYFSEVWFWALSSLLAPKHQRRLSLIISAFTRSYRQASCLTQSKMFFYNPLIMMKFQIFSWYVVKWYFVCKLQNPSHLYERTRQLYWLYSEHIRVQSGTN